VQNKFGKARPWQVRKQAQGEYNTKSHLQRLIERNETKGRRLDAHETRH
jgi:hypothetical protein